MLRTAMFLGVLVESVSTTLTAGRQPELGGMGMALLLGICAAVPGAFALGKEVFAALAEPEQLDPIVAARGSGPAPTRHPSSLGR